MKRAKILLSILFVSVVFLFFNVNLLSKTAQQNISNIELESIIIEKFRRINKDLSWKNPAKIHVTLRLADLLAERGRKEFIRDMRSGCTKCEAGEKDRKQALAYYLSALPRLSPDKKGPVLTQVGHLYQLVGDSQKAIDMYKVAIKKDKREEFRLEAKFSLAELYFKSQRFKQAYPYYNELMKTSDKRKAVSAYRRAWCLFNLGKTQEAILALEHVLVTPVLLKRATFSSELDTEVIRSELSHDLVVFYSKARRDLIAAERIYELSPEGRRIPNLVYLASELGRLGEQKGALKVWEFVLSKQTEPRDRFESHLHLAQTRIDLNQVKLSQDDYKKALKLWEKILPCNEQVCNEWRSRLKNYVVDWNRVEEDNPSKELAQTYENYLKLFPEDGDMMVWLAQIQVARKNWQGALNTYTELFKALKRDKVVLKNVKPKPTYEFILLRQLEIAVASEDEKLQKQAYSRYLALSREKTKLQEVRYKNAYLMYKAGDYEKAAQAFRKLAQTTGKGEGFYKIRKKSADLALDSLVLLKKEAMLAVWANEFSELFPTDKSEYGGIARKSMLNQSASFSQTGNDEKAWEALSQVDLSGASEKQKRLYYKNRLILAEKLKKLPEALLAVENLLKIKDLSKEDRQFALSRKVWLAEMSLDFSKALEVTKLLNLKELTPEKKILKMSLYANLAGKDPSPYYKVYLKEGEDKDKKLAMAVHLVNHSESFEKALRQYSSTIQTQKGLYPQMYLEALSRRFPNWSDKKDIQPFIKDFSKTHEAQVLKRYKFLNEFKAFHNKIGSVQIVSSSNKRLTRSLKKRIKLLQKAEKLVGQAVALDDWTAQMVSVYLVFQEAQRFYKEILALPVPEGLNPEEQQVYLSMLSQQADPYRAKAAQYEAKFKEFWANKGIVGDFRKAYSQANDNLRKVLRHSFEFVLWAAPEVEKQQIEEILKMPSQDQKVAKNPKHQRLSTKLREAKEQVKKDPFNISYLKHLKELEGSLGNETMANYLSDRISQINKESL